MELSEKLKQKVPFLLDGSMGAVLMANGYKPADILPLNITNPEVIQDIHKGYFASGCDAVITNTFNLNSFSLPHIDFSVREITEAALRNALAAKNSFSNRFVALGLGPSGEKNFENAYELYKEILSVDYSDADLVILETAGNTTDVEAARKAVRESSYLPFWASLTFKESERTWFGTSLEEWTEYVNSSDIDAAGINCTLMPNEMLPLAIKLMQAIKIPCFAEPNRGQPKKTENGFKYDMNAEDYAQNLAKFYENGIYILGGCCGADSECMKKTAQILKEEY